MWCEKLQNGKYRFCERYKDPFTEKERKVSIVFATRSNQAQNKASKLLNEKIEKKLSQPKSNKCVWSDVYNEWWSIYKNTVKYNTQMTRTRNKKKLDAYITDDMLISNINSSFLTDILNDLYYNKNLSYSYIDSMISLLHSVFQFAQDRDYISHNPARKIRIKKKPITIEQMQIKNNNFLEMDELKEVLRVAYKKNSKYGRLFEFMSLTGLRVGEAVALKNASIVGNDVKITSTFNFNNQKLETPKNDYSYRTIALNDRCLELIEQQNQFNYEQSGNPTFIYKDFIFSSTRGNPFHISDINAFLRNKVQPDLVVTQKKVRTHIFRHTHISLLSELGLPLKSIMERVGHNNPQTTLSIYTHVTEALKKSMSDKLNTLNIAP